MLRNYRSLVLVGFIAVLGCEKKAAQNTPSQNATSEDLKREAGEVMQSAADLALKAKKKFEEEFGNRLDELDVEIAKLREKGSDLTAEAKSEWEQAMANLETKRAAASDKLSEVGASSMEALGELQKGAQSAWEDLSKAVQEAAKKFK